MTDAWKRYQEEAAEFFRSLGMTADTDVPVQGVRTAHHIDVLVTLPYAGFPIRWIIECKRWHTRITKLHVLALREIVSDIGADRGILLAEEGFQAGAILSRAVLGYRQIRPYRPGVAARCWAGWLHGRSHHHT